MITLTQTPTDQEEEVENLENYSEETSDTPLEDARTAILHRLLYISSAVFVLLMLIFSIVPIPLEQQFEFSLKSDQKDFIYRFPEIVYVNACLVKAGQNVEKGTPLFKITSPEIASQIAHYQQASHALENFYQHDTLLFHSERNHLALELREVQLLIKKNLGTNTDHKSIQEQELQQTESQAKEALRRWEVGQKLYASKTISEMELKDMEQDKIKKQAQFEITQSTYKIQTNQMSHELSTLAITESQLLEKLAKLRLQEQKQESLLKTNLAEISQKIKLTYGDFRIENENLVILAETKGQVAYVLETEKEVEPTAVLMKINQNKSEIYAYASVSPKNVSYIKPQQKAYLKINTFPHYEWGGLAGEVNSVSHSPDAKGMYPFQIRLNEKGKIGNLLQTGMTGYASIVVEEKTIFGLVFRKFNQWRDKKVYGMKDE